MCSSNHDHRANYHRAASERQTPRWNIIWTGNVDTIHMYCMYPHRMVSKETLRVWKDLFQSCSNKQEHICIYTLFFECTHGKIVILFGIAVGITKEEGCEMCTLNRDMYYPSTIGCVCDTSLCANLGSPSWLWLRVNQLASLIRALCRPKQTHSAFLLLCFHRSLGGEEKTH